MIWYIIGAFFGALLSLFTWQMNNMAYEMGAMRAELAHLTEAVNRIAPR
jgi:hypothetical protein